MQLAIFTQKGRYYISQFFKQLNELVQKLRIKLHPLKISRRDFQVLLRRIKAGVISKHLMKTMRFKSQNFKVNLYIQ